MKKQQEKYRLEQEERERTENVEMDKNAPKQTNCNGDSQEAPANDEEMAEGGGSEEEPVCRAPSADENEIDSNEGCVSMNGKVESEEKDLQEIRKEKNDIENGGTTPLVNGGAMVPDSGDKKPANDEERMQWVDEEMKESCAEENKLDAGGVDQEMELSVAKQEKAWLVF